MNTLPPRVPREETPVLWNIVLFIVGAIGGGVIVAWILGTHNSEHASKHKSSAVAPVTPLPPESVDTSNPNALGNVPADVETK